MTTPWRTDSILPAPPEGAVPVLHDREYRVEIGKLRNERKQKLPQLLAEARKRHPDAAISESNLAQHDAKGATELKRIDDRIDYYNGSMSEKILMGLAAKAKAVRATKPEEQFIRALTEQPGQVPDTHLFYRGLHENPRQAVEPAELRILVSHKQPDFPVKDAKRRSSGRRLAYARDLTDGDHPLVARVLVNRVWAHHFGRGIVGSLGDFGALGEKPTHPGLLDWLASDFMANGWKLKRLHKLIMTSAAYRQSSRRSPALDRVDPENRLLARMSVRRLDAEALRDSILAVSGKLNVALHGKPVPVKEDGVRMEQAVSVPSAMSAEPSCRLTPAPQDDPPATRSTAPRRRSRSNLPTVEGVSSDGVQRSPRFP